jgi:pyruvate dehydrogenase E1 component alpha subunit/2-oxoisovalerate dehydrogenase E1 component
VGACRALEERDALTVTYRGHGWALARGLPIAHLFAELLGRDSPLCGGRAGSAYLLSAAHGFLGENSIVGAGLPLAAGAALAARFKGDGSASVCALGDGAMNQGGVHEALNFAAYQRLPLVVVLENNRYSELTPIAAMIATETLVERAQAYGMPGVQIDGNDADEVEAAVTEALARARQGGGPTLIEAMTERIVGHYDADPQHYRPKGEIESALEREPLARLRARLGEETVRTMDAEVEAVLDAALEEALNLPFPDPATAREHVVV